MHIDYKVVAQDLTVIAREAGLAIMQIYNTAENVEVTAKEDHSPLTNADLASNTIICDGLKALDIDLPVISEENKEIAYVLRKDYTHFWLIDPLDGTKEFIKRNGEFTVNIALIQAQRPVLGVVYAPYLDELYWGYDDVAYMNKKGNVEQIHAATFNIMDAGLKVVCSRSHLNADTQAFIDNLNQPEKVSRGSSLKFMMLATGEAHLYPRLAPTMEWDTAAAHAVLNAAGGSVTYHNNRRKPLVYNKENLLNPHFVAYGRRT